MTRTLFSFLVFATLASNAPAAIDLTPIPTVRDLEGMKFPGLTFRENGKVVTYEQPRGWKYAGGGARLRFSPPNLPQAQAEIDQAPLAAPQNFTEEVMIALRHRALAAVPPNSLKVELVSEAVDAFLVNGHHTCEMIVAYEAMGRKFMMGVIYVNLPDTQLRFRTVALKDDFENVHGEFRGSIFSLQWQ